MALSISGNDVFHSPYYQGLLSANASSPSFSYSGWATSSSGGLVLSVAAGSGYTSGAWQSVAGSYLTLSAANASGTRLDLVVVSGTSYAVREGGYYSGTNRAVSPNVFAGEVPLAIVTVGSGVTSVSASEIRDIRFPAAFKGEQYNGGQLLQDFNAGAQAISYNNQTGSKIVYASGVFSTRVDAGSKLIDNITAGSRTFAYAGVDKLVITSAGYCGTVQPQVLPAFTVNGSTVSGLSLFSYDTIGSHAALTPKTGSVCLYSPCDFIVNGSLLRGRREEYPYNIQMASETTEFYMPSGVTSLWMTTSKPNLFYSATAISGTKAGSVYADWLVFGAAGENVGSGVSRVKFDLGAAYGVEKLALTGRVDAGSMTIYSSPDDSAWTARIVVSETSNTTKQAYDIGSQRYFRLDASFSSSFLLRLGVF